jgi:hypothetical protein
MYWRRGGVHGVFRDGVQGTLMRKARMPASGSPASARQTALRPSYSLPIGLIVRSTMQLRPSARRLRRSAARGRSCHWQPRSPLVRETMVWAICGVYFGLVMDH